MRWTARLLYNFRAISTAHFNKSAGSTQFACVTYKRCTSNRDWQPKVPQPDRTLYQVSKRSKSVWWWHFAGFFRCRTRTTTTCRTKSSSLVSLASTSTSASASASASVSATSTSLLLNSPSSYCYHDFSDDASNRNTCDGVTVIERHQLLSKQRPQRNRNTNSHKI